MTVYDFKSRLFYIWIFYLFNRRLPYALFLYLHPYPQPERPVFQLRGLPYTFYLPSVRQKFLFCLYFYFALSTFCYEIPPWFIFLLGHGPKENLSDPHRATLVCGSPLRMPECFTTQEHLNFILQTIATDVFETLDLRVSKSRRNTTGYTFLGISLFRPLRVISLFFAF